MPPRVTLSDVAADAGVSRATASLVVRGDRRITPATSERVLASMRRLGYVYHHGAAALRLKRTNTIGLVVTDVTNPFFAETTVGLEAALSAAGFVTLLANTFDDLDRQNSLVRAMIERQVDGLIMVPALGSDRTLIEWLTGAGLPHLLLTRYLRDVSAPYLGADDALGGELAATHLIAEHGCRRLAYIGGNRGATARRDRVNGVRRAMRAGGLDSRTLTTLNSPTSTEAGIALGTELAADPDAFDGLICHSDIIAFGVYRALRDRLPARKLAAIRVVGFDDVAQAAVWEPPLTSITIHPRKVGEQAARLITALIGHEAPTPPLIEPELVIRRSCGCHK